MGSAPKAPAAPDPAATAAAQGAANKETAYWNSVMGNVNQTTPYGSIQYSDSSNGVYDPNKAPTFSSTITLSPAQQKLLDSQQANDQGLQDLGTAQMGRISDAVSSPYSFTGMPSAPTATDVNALSQQGQDAIMSRLNPQFDRDEEALRTRLINQGIGQGSEAYNNEFNTFNQAKNDARQQAILGGQSYGGNEEQQQLALRNQAIQEYNAQRNAPLNEYSALTSGQQIQNPSFSGSQAGNAQAGDIQGATQSAYQNAMGLYNSKVGSQNATQGALFGLGGSALSGFLGSSAGSAALAGLFSDARLKDNIKPKGQENGHNVYEFNYRGEDKKYIGVMADEVQETNPEAVHEVQGYLTVDYPMIGVNFREAE